MITSISAVVDFLMFFVWGCRSLLLSALCELIEGWHFFQLGVGEEVLAG